MFKAVLDYIATQRMIWRHHLSTADMDRRFEDKGMWYGHLWAANIKPLPKENLYLFRAPQAGSSHNRGVSSGEKPAKLAWAAPDADVQDAFFIQASC